MFFLICFLGLASASPPDLDVSYETGATAPNDAAAVLFVEDYVHLQDVDGARRDAELMRRTFKDVVGIPEKQVRVTSASRSRMKSTVISAAKKVKDGGTLWVYFSGYGLVRNGEWLLLGKDTKEDASTAARDGLNLQGLLRMVGPLKNRSGGDYFGFRLQRHAPGQLASGEPSPAGTSSLSSPE